MPIHTIAHRFQRHLPSVPSVSASTVGKLRAGALGLLTFACGMAFASEANVRAQLPKKLPDLPAIKSVTATPVKGLYEVVVGESDVLYVTGDARYILQGDLIDVESKTSLTEQRVEELTKVHFDKLDFRNSFKIVRGNGKRQMAVFEDPNCGYCKRFEKQLKTIDNVTVHMFLLPILGEDSVTKSANIWCARDKGKTWLKWMTEDVKPPKVMKKCDTSALMRNVEFARRYRINGTPVTFFTDNARVGGAVSMDRIRNHLEAAEAAAKSSKGSKGGK